MKWGYTHTPYVRNWGWAVTGELRYGRTSGAGPHPAYRGTSNSEYVGFSRRQGNPKVWSCAWIRPKKEPRRGLERRYG